MLAVPDWALPKNPRQDKAGERLKTKNTAPSPLRRPRSAPVALLRHWSSAPPGGLPRLHDRCYTPRGLPWPHERCYSPSSVVVPRRARRRSTACPSSVGVPSVVVVPRRARPSASPRAPSVVVVPRRARPSACPSLGVAARALRRRRPSACPSLGVPVPRRRRARPPSSSSLGVPVVLARARLLASRFCETFPNAFQYAF